MLLERLYYADDFPMNITIAHIQEDPPHYHLDIEILYVLHGSLRLKNGYCHYELHEGDVFTNSGHEVHSLTSDDPSCVVAQFQLKTRYFSQYFPDLSKACYRTYSKKPSDKKHDRLRELLLQILLKYTARGAHWRNDCTYLMADTIRHLDKYFNLFAFDKGVVVGFDRGNSVAIERISRICQYIYQYYSDNITLEDLSQMEHLNSFYLSHLIKEFTGMSFRDFLCFARVEWSEIALLDSDAKISRIARDVGFSTTAYYNKYFKKWFGCTPEEHRALYQPQIKSDLHPAIWEALPKSQAEMLIKRTYANYHLKKSSSSRSLPSSLVLEAAVQADAPTLFPLHRALSVSLTSDDLRALDMRLLTTLQELQPTEIVLLKHPGESASELRELKLLLRRAGLSFRQADICETAPNAPSAALDSILYPLHLAHTTLRDAASPFSIRLRDADGDLLQGQNALLTCTGTRKPVYYACLALSRLWGDVIYSDNQCAVIRLSQDTGISLCVIVYNVSESGLAACQETLDHRQVRTLLHDFQDEISVHISLHLPSNVYAIRKYTLSQAENIFAHLSNLDFRSCAPLAAADHAGLLSGAPTLEVYSDDVRTVLELSCTIRGAGAQVIYIQPL